MASATGARGPAAAAGQASPSACEPARAGDVGIVVVVDAGAASDEPGSAGVTCVSVPSGSDGTVVLAERAERLGVPPPRYDPSGLLCAIDGRPETGCGDPTEAGGFRYWSYWLGTDAGWEHAPMGPAFREVAPAVVEGWHFVDGSGRPGDPPPGIEPARAMASAESGDAGRTDDAGRALDGDEARALTADDGGSPMGFALGVVAVAGLAGLAIVVARRRRSA